MKSEVYLSHRNGEWFAQVIGENKMKKLIEKTVIVALLGSGSFLTIIGFAAIIVASFK